MSKHKCLAWEKQCYNCNCQNRFTRVSKKSGRVLQVDVEEIDADGGIEFITKLCRTSRHQTFKENTAYVEWCKCHACRLDTSGGIQPQKSEEMLFRKRLRRLLERAQHNT